MAAIAILALFALLSLGPVAGVFRSVGVRNIIINGAFLATSLWGLLLGFFAVRWLMSSDYRSRSFESGGGPPPAYAFVWCAAYLIYIQVQV